MEHITEAQHDEHIKRFKELATKIIGDLMDAKMRAWFGTDRQTLHEEIYWLEAIALQVAPMANHLPVEDHINSCHGRD